MCGIAGALSARPDSTLTRLVSDLTHNLRHRGPDGCGFWSDEGGLSTDASSLAGESKLVLGHRRLSIVDLLGGSQPLANEAGTVWVSYNGEIYNAPELRSQLIAAGHHFKTSSDTEVLVHGWEEWRHELFGRLNGIFAFALYDQRDGAVRLVRDPIGVKPLYLGISKERTWWASELRAGVKAGIVDEGWDRDSLKLYLLFRFIPSPRTLHESTWKIPPSHFVELFHDQSGDRPRFVRYRTRVISDAHPRNGREWSEALIGELSDATERQLMSDVPVGTLLSGGIDSSLITQLMSRRMAAPPQAFCVGFASHGKHSETFAAENAAASLGTPLKTRLVEDDAYLAEWPASIRAMSEPIGNASSLLLGYACRLAKETHKVVLTGQGADEPLGGYPRHVAERLYRLGRIAPHVSGAIAQHVLGSDAGPRLRRALVERDVNARFATILSVLPFDEVDRLVPGATPARELARDVIAAWLPEDWSNDPVNALLEVDARTSLADDLLLVADHVSMAESVELRVPFLDLRLFDLISRMPSKYKVSNFGRRKWLYRNAALEALPSNLAKSLGGLHHSMGKKVGFRTPVDRWFAEGADALRDSEWQGQLTRLPLIDRGAVEATLSTRSGDGTRLRHVLYTLAQWGSRD